MVQYSTTQSRCCPQWFWQNCPHPRCPGRGVFETVGFELGQLTPGEGREALEVKEGGQALLLLSLLLFPGEQGDFSSLLSAAHIHWQMALLPLYISKGHFSSQFCSNFICFPLLALDCNQIRPFNLIVGSCICSLTISTAIEHGHCLSGSLLKMSFLV